MRTAWAKGPLLHYIRVDSYYSNGSFRTYADAGRLPWAGPDETHFTAMVNDKNLVAHACLFIDDPRYGTVCTSGY